MDPRLPGSSTSPCCLLTPCQPHPSSHPAAPSAIASSARPRTARARLAQRQAWASGADATRRHSKALCCVDFRALKQRNPHWPCEGLAEVIHAWSGGSRRLQRNAHWHAFCWGWEAGYGGKFLLLSAHSLLKLLIKPTSGSHVHWLFHYESSRNGKREEGKTQSQLEGPRQPWPCEDVPLHQLCEEVHQLYSIALLQLLYYICFFFSPRG